MKDKLELCQDGHTVKLLTPALLEKLAEQVCDLTAEDRAVINMLLEKLNNGEG